MSSKMHTMIYLKKENSWYLKVGQTHHFLCQCGQEEQYSDAMILDMHHPLHCCSHCGNTHYLDSFL